MTPPLLHVQHLSKQFRLKGEVFHAVQNISFSVAKGEILGIGGESGCGKSTIAKLLMGLCQPTSGSIFFEGKKLSDLMAQKSQSWRRDIQMVFQHPAASLNPRMTIEKILLEPFKIHGLMKGIEHKKQLISLLSQVGLSEDYLQRLPHELSGGQKQRIAIARALALEPRFLICDEPFSALDVSIQAQMINLLTHLQKENNFSYLIISHDLSILRYLTHQLAIMYAGQFIEYGPSSDIYHDPLHPYSQLLISSILIPDFKSSRAHPIPVKEEISLLRPSLGCPFATRCPHAQKSCHTLNPKWKEIKPGHFTACHLY